MAWYMAVYTGRHGPISKGFEACDLAAARKRVTASSVGWYDDGEDDLDLPPGTTHTTIADALKDQGYSDNLASNDPLWSLYRQDRHALEWWNWHDSEYSRWDGDTETAAARCLAWLRGESTDGPETSA